MRRIFRIIDGIIRYWWVVLLTVALLCLTGCRTQYIPVETVRTEHVYNTEFLRDSIFVKDSVFIKEKNDTIYLTKWRIEYREALRVDTVLVVHTESEDKIVEVEKKLTKWQLVKMNIGGGIVWAVPILIAVGLFLLYRKLKK